MFGAQQAQCGQKYDWYYPNAKAPAIHNPNDFASILLSQANADRSSRTVEVEVTPLGHDVRLRRQNTLDNVFVKAAFNSVSCNHRHPLGCLETAPETTGFAIRLSNDQEGGLSR
jgi:hypothetical protein